MNPQDTRLANASAVQISLHVEPSCTVADETGAIACYEGEIPIFVEAELDRLYGNLFSSLVYLKAYNKLAPDTSTYVARRGAEVVAIFLFCRTGKAVRVLNEGMKSSEEEASRFATFIFSRYPSVETIFFRAVRFGVKSGGKIGTSALPFSFQTSNCPGDVIADLPPIADDYLTGLGKNARKNIRRNERKITESFPSFRLDFFDGATASEAHIRRIIDLNRARMADRGNDYRRSEAEVQGLLALTKSYGLIGVATIDGEVCAGSIGLKIGNTCTGRIIAHDPRYNSYGLGLLCAYFATRESIVRGSLQFNFMAGNNEFKNMLGGRLQDQQNMVIYRSRLSALKNAHVGLRMMGQRLAFNAISTLQEKIRDLEREEAQQRSDLKSRASLYALKTIRRVKQFLSSLPGKKD